MVSELGRGAAALYPPGQAVRPLMKGPESRQRQVTAGYLLLGGSPNLHPEIRDVCTSTNSQDTQGTSLPHSSRRAHCMALCLLRSCPVRTPVFMLRVRELLGLKLVPPFAGTVLPRWIPSYLSRQGKYGPGAIGTRFFGPSLAGFSRSGAQDHMAAGIA